MSEQADVLSGVRVYTYCKHENVLSSVFDIIRSEKLIVPIVINKIEIPSTDNGIEIPSSLQSDLAPSDLSLEALEKAFPNGVPVDIQSSLNRTYLDNLTRHKFFISKESQTGFLEGRTAFRYSDISSIVPGFPFWISWPEAPKGIWYSSPVHSIFHFETYNFHDKITIYDEVIDCPTLNFNDIVVSYSKIWEVILSDN